MEISAQIQGSHTVASPSGQYVASISTGKLRICSTHAPDRCTEVTLRTAKDVTSLKWNRDCSRLAILSPQHVEVVDLDDANHRVRLDNGSGGLGRFTSADFVGSHQLLVTWEFGKAKLWDLSNGKGVELSDIKTASGGTMCQTRPAGGNLGTQTLATLSRPGADDILNVYFPAIQKQLSSTKLPTVDAQSLSWSPDGRWLTVLDTPVAGSSVHILTPDGHLFRSYPSPSEANSNTLGVKSVVWSGNSQILALTKHDGRIVLLNTKTFVPLAIIEHTTSIDQRSLPQDQQAPIWQEAVAPSADRSYSRATQPVSPPLSRTKPSLEPSELGVAEAHFSCDGNFLATRDERMLNTVWIWNMSTLAAYTVLIQHSNVRRLHWHPTRPELLMLDCGEGIAYLCSVSSTNPPQPLSTGMPAGSTLSWIYGNASTKPALISATKSSFRLVYPEGQTQDLEPLNGYAVSGSASNDAFDEGPSEDSLFDVLSGRTPLPPKTDPSYTEMVDVEVETEEEDMTTRVDDTFREKKSRRPVLMDPLDDSEIF